MLLIGDSISMGYTLPVRELLKDRANVHRIPTNGGPTTNGLKHTKDWLGTSKWDVIHFNFGLHDVKYLDEKGALVSPEKGKQVASVAEYEKNLRALVASLKKTGAKLIFATTTPVPAGSAGRVEHSEIPYNVAAIRVMKENGVAVDDLHAFVVARQDKIQLPKNVHFTNDGSEQLADTVVASIGPLRRVMSARVGPLATSATKSLSSLTGCSVSFFEKRPVSVGRCTSVEADLPS